MTSKTDKYCDEYICEQLKSFKLVDIREHYQEIIDEAIQEKLGYKDFLTRLIKAEEEGKRKRLKERLLLKAGFDFIKTEHLYTFDGVRGYSLAQGE
jgi:hypothetical protein